MSLKFANTHQKNRSLLKLKEWEQIHRWIQFILYMNKFT